MNQNDPLEQRLESLGAALQERPRLTDRVMEQVRQMDNVKGEAHAAFAENDRRQPIGHARRWKMFSAAAVATCALGLLMIFWPSRSAGWEDVLQAVRARPWMRGTVTYLDGKQGTMWLSLKEKLWAFRTEDSMQFFDGGQHAKYEFETRNKQILKLPLGEEDAQRVMPIENLSRDKQVLGSWLFGEKIVDQKRREIEELGQKWIEFDLVLWRGDTNHATLRVDPKTKLPVFMLVKSPIDSKKSFKWLFDYPEEGPHDIYALGIPAAIPIDETAFWTKTATPS